MFMSSLWVAENQEIGMFAYAYIQVLYNCGRIFLYYHFSLVISYLSV